MQIERRGKRGIFHVRFTGPDGRRIRRTTGTTDRQRAQEFADRLKASLWRASRLGDRPARSWPDAVLRWVSETKHKRTHGEDIAKLRWLDRHLGRLHLHQVTPDVIERIRADLESGNAPSGGRSAGTVAKYLALVRSILRAAAGRWDWLDKAPTVTLPRSTARDPAPRWLTRKQAAELLAALRAAELGHTADMAELTLATGLRQLNVTGLRWDRVDLVERRAWVDSTDTKNARALAVPLNTQAVAILRRQLFRHRDLVFVYRGRPIHRPNTRAWRRVLTELGLRPDPGRSARNFRWHDLRHTWASWHVQAGTPLPILQALGGWSSLDMVMKYAHLSPGLVADYADAIVTKTDHAAGGLDGDGS